VYAVKSVQWEVIAALNDEKTNLGTAFQSYQARKANGPASKHFATLGQGYHFERKTYLASGKKLAPFSGTLISDKLKDGREIHDLKLSEFQKIGEKTSVRMYFLNKIQRMKQLVQFTNAHWTDIEGQPFTTQKTNPAWGLANKNDCNVWAMDRYGNLFVVMDNRQHGDYVLGDKVRPAVTARQARGQTNHSSICAGRDIICAGEIFFWKGQLIHIDNSSGHYAPRREQLRRAVEILVDQGANPAYLRVEVFGTPGFFSATGLLHNLSQPDWPIQEWPDGKQNSHDAIYQRRGLTL
jgi:hypothetical protein